MSDLLESEDFTQDAPPEEPRGLRRQLEEQAAKAKAAEDRAARAERELAFAKVPGLDLTDPKVSYFTKGYEGEYTPEAIRAAAEAAGFIGTPSPTVPPEELREHQAAAALAGGGMVEPPDSNAEYNAAMAAARTRDEVLAVMDRYGSQRLGIIPQ